jgi:predicted GNAT family acetyltransferase
MVPANFNEMYISFLFTHPEWRRAGIASFLLYHLTQVEALCFIFVANAVVIISAYVGLKDVATYQIVERSTPYLNRRNK